jgi:hypothetical protein
MAKSRSRSPRVRPTPVPGTPALVRRGAAALILGGAIGCSSPGYQSLPPQTPPHEETMVAPEDERSEAVEPDELPPTPPQVAPPPPQPLPPQVAPPQVRRAPQPAPQLPPRPEFDD